MFLCVQYTFLANAVLLFCGGVVIFFGLVSAPRDVGLPDPDEDTTAECHHEDFPHEVTDHRPQAVSFWRAILLPGSAPNLSNRIPLNT